MASATIKFAIVTKQLSDKKENNAFEPKEKKLVDEDEDL